MTPDFNVDWTKANCIGTDSEAFYPEKGEKAKEAVAVCNRCEIINECFEYGLKREVHGVWGGTLPGERRLHRSRRGMPVEQIDISDYVPREWVQPRDYSKDGSGS